MQPLPICPSFAVIESSIDRVAKRTRGAPVQDLVLIRLIKHLTARFSLNLGRMVRPAGLNEVSFRTLMMLYANAEHGVHASMLSDATGETRANITRICDELARKGLLQRHPGVEDRRRVALELTRKGETLIERLLPKVWAQLQTGMRALNAGEKRQLERLLKKLVAVFEDFEVKD
jgi:MarR family transcriptional repressor of emrRAB